MSRLRYAAGQGDSMGLRFLYAISRARRSDRACSSFGLFRARDPARLRAWRCWCAPPAISRARRSTCCFAGAFDDLPLRAPGLVVGTLVWVGLSGRSIQRAPRRRDDRRAGDRAGGDDPEALRMLETLAFSRGMTTPRLKIVVEFGAQRLCVPVSRRNNNAVVRSSAGLVERSSTTPRSEAVYGARADPHPQRGRAADV